jgi:hypothetical protein
MFFTASGAATFTLNGKVQAQVILTSSDPQVLALGYVAEHLKVDKN